MTWLEKTADGATELDRVFGLLPQAYERFRVMYATLWDPAVFDPATLELCRLRVAALLGGPLESPFGGYELLHGDLMKGKTDAVAGYATSPLFSDRERSCIAFAEQYVLDPHALTDEDFAALSKHCAPIEIATLTLAVATFDALTRMRLALDAAGDDAGGAR